MNQNDKYVRVYSLLGLAEKAGRVKSGEFMTEESVKSGKAFLVIVADDASDNTKKNFVDMCKYYETDCIVFGSKERLGHAIGKEMRASLAVIDAGFSKSIQKQISTADIREDDKE